MDIDRTETGNLNKDIVSGETGGVGYPCRDSGSELDGMLKIYAMEPRMSSPRESLRLYAIQENGPRRNAELSASTAETRGISCLRLGTQGHSILMILSQGRQAQQVGRSWVNGEGVGEW